MQQQKKKLKENVRQEETEEMMSKAVALYSYREEIPSLNIAKLYKKKVRSPWTGVNEKWDHASLKNYFPNVMPHICSTTVFELINV